MSSIQLKNMLGDIRAESDSKMLDVAFVQTPEYKGIVETRDFNFIVGRRGSGKSAIKYSALKEFELNKSLWTYDIINNDYDMLTVQSKLRDLVDDYRIATHIMKISTKVSIALELIHGIYTNYKKGKLSYESTINGIYQEHKKIIEMNFFKRCASLISNAAKDGCKPLEIPGMIAEKYKIEKLYDIVIDSLDKFNKRVVVLFDNLDDGWIPMPIETAIIGGLSHTAIDFRDRGGAIHLYLFSRDNMFRALATLDTDFTRNIEGATVRLKWDDNSLFHLVAERMRNAFNLKEVENHTKIWNRAAKFELSGREGFKICTNNTLYRPRDIISLLNRGFAISAKDNRQGLILQDISFAAKEISESRLNDLSNEYATVFPSLGTLIELFRDTSCPYGCPELLNEFDSFVASKKETAEETRDFSILESGESCFAALYSIGFLGVQLQESGQVSFCHDGATMAKDDGFSEKANIWVHPCYWNALNIASKDTIDISSNIYDDYGTDTKYSKEEIADLRMKQIGKVITDVAGIPAGREGASEYEGWVLRAIKILFSRNISNLELHPNGNAITRRDIVGTIVSTNGFWGRVLQDYGTRQIIFDAKNYEDITLEDIRQMQDYLTEGYGNFGIIVPRTTRESLSEVEIGWIRHVWANHKKIIFIIPHEFIARCIRKQRSKDRFDYAEEHLMKQLDTYERRFTAQKH